LNRPRRKVPDDVTAFYDAVRSVVSARPLSRRWAGRLSEHDAIIRLFQIAQQPQGNRFRVVQLREQQCRRLRGQLIDRLADRAELGPDLACDRFIAIADN